jgi:DNA repair protein RadC
MPKHLPYENNIGHRQRLKTRLLNSKSETMSDYELLELILFLAVPRKDVKQLAKNLINHFGSFGQIINAKQDDLEEIKDINNSIISTFRIIKESSALLSKEKVDRKISILSSWKSLLDYCRVTMGYNSTEQLRIFYLNKKNILIKDELQEYGTIDNIALYPREIARKALLINASAIIIVHNHPTGNTTPSSADIEVTKKLIEALKIFNIMVHDHIIISSQNHFSFKSNNLI